MTKLVPVQEAERLLIVAASDVEPVLVAAALERGLERGVTRLFLPPFGLGRLRELPAFRGGARPTLTLGFPAPALAEQPEDARAALGAAADLIWVSGHPVEPGELGGVRVEATGGGELWPAVARALGCSAGLMDALAGVLAEPPAPAPPSEWASFELAWRYAIEAGRQEPFTLGAHTRALVAGEPAPADLAATGRALVDERRELAASSAFHVFPTPAGPGVLVMAPRSAAGFYADLARDARRARGCALSVVAFDSHEPVVVEAERRPADLDARIALVHAALPDHVVRGFGPAGLAIRGPAAGGQALLVRLLELLGQEIV